MSDLSLAIFTKCTEDVLEDPKIYDSLTSLITAFQTQDFATLIIYVDPGTKPKIYKKYVEKLNSYGFYTVKAKNKEDAYRDALEACETKYLMTVGDNWYYDNESISHSLQDMCYWMTKYKLSIFALNDRKNMKMPKIDPELLVVQEPGKPFCRVNKIKAEPQIVDVLRMRQIMVLHETQEARDVLAELNEVAVYGAYGKISSVSRLRKESKK